MKKSDIAMIILIASISVIVAFMVGNQLSFLKPPEKGQKVKVAEKIDAKVTDPDPNAFKPDAINPTIQTVIGGGQAPQ
ncbi:MAG: hypothetical protein WBO49_01920 [Candidatus Saccharimonas sp.]